MRVRSRQYTKQIEHLFKMNRDDSVFKPSDFTSYFKQADIKHDQTYYSGIYHYLSIFPLSYTGES